MAFPYLLKSISLSYVGGIHIQLIEQQPKPEIYWQCELPNSKDCELTLLQPLDAQRFIAVLATGMIFIGDSERKQLTLLAQFRCGIAPGCWLDTEQQQLWLAANFRHQTLKGRQLVCIDLTTGELLLSQPINTSEIELETLTQRNDGQCAFYARNSKPGYKFRQHWIYTIDPETGEQQKQPLASKPLPDAISMRPGLFPDKTRGLILLPYADSLKQIDSNTFGYQLQMLDLNQGQIVWTKTVRYLQLDSIVPPSEQQALSEGLTRIASGQYAHTDSQHWLRLLSCLTGVWFHPQSDEIYLTWQDCRLQKIDLDGERLSSLYQIGVTNKSGELELPWRWDINIDKLTPLDIEEDRLLIGYRDECENQLQVVSLADEKVAPLSTEQPKWLVAEERHAQLVHIPQAIQAQPSSSGCIHISSSDLHTESGAIQALQQLLALMPALERAFTPTQSSLLSRMLGAKDNMPQPKEFYVAFSDALGRSQSEYQFFYDAACYQSCRPLIAEIIQAFNQWSCANSLHGYDTEPPLANAACSLAPHREYLAVLAEHLSAIGGGEDIHGFHINYTLACIREDHQDTAELTRFLASVPWPYHDPDFVKPIPDPYDEWDDE